jgi:hypothetical protein
MPSDSDADYTSPTQNHWFTPPALENVLSKLKIDKHIGIFEENGKTFYSPEKITMNMEEKRKIMNMEEKRKII